MQGSKALVELPNRLAISWLLGWANAGYVFVPYGMWKHQRTQTQA